MINILFQRYWKEVAIGLVIIILMVFVFIRNRQLENRDKDIELLLSRVAALDSAVVQLQNEQLLFKSLLEGQADIIKEVAAREKEAEIIYNETVIDNSKVVENYIANPTDPEVIKELYEFKNHAWQSISGDYNE